MDRMKSDQNVQSNETGSQYTGSDANPRPQLDTEINQPGPSTATPNIPQEIPVR